ncbi:uncharacterized protein Z519_03921 [Cladophialophora bantiana CBS 173.52]|uniref:Extracellular membrane protein CFEM domain-containing protein n=1 Tax=Cladophialophora bantiana (strain ATCC 10958 / CBS 173.52 / CDC B-1940 / NIH 8579) TaxID=1442370 RepID=A0A0D2G9N6_CLAB1|nr:uncharacterized protein Z519_03921 [Cladophialophora bantiana CBS 173.52]KIW95337.1 hypothetical protein Z519_03921 [Cladophialophora bantiana CBS 173.52]
MAILVLYALALTIPPISCNSEQRLCAANGYVDKQVDSALSEWHLQCDTFISFAPTTPVLSTITSTYDVDSCSKAIEACIGRSQEIEACTYTYGSTDPGFSSCYCQPKILSLAYSCEILGHGSCREIPATVTNLAQYSICPNFCDVLDCNDTKKTISSSSATINTKVTGSADDNTVTITSPPPRPATTTMSSVTTTSSGSRQLVAWELGALALMAALIRWIL